MCCNPVKIIVVVISMSVCSLVIADEEPVARFAGIPAEYRDAAFEQFVGPQWLGGAWQEQDAARLADAGLALAAGERVLLRSHRQLPADVVLRYALALAGEQGDQATLTRLARAEVVTQHPALAQALQAARQQAAGKALPATSTGQSVPGELLYTAFQQDVREARLTHDAKVLSVLREIAADLPSLSASQRQQVQEWVRADIAGPAEPARLTLRYYQLAYQAAEYGPQPRHFLRTSGVLEQLLTSGKGPVVDQARKLHQKIRGFCQPNDPGCE